MITRARILKLSSDGKVDNEIAEALGITRITIYHIRKNYADGEIQNALYDKPRPGKERILTTAEEATITAIACSDPKEGYAGWTPDLTTGEFNNKTNKSISRNTVWRVLRRNKLKPHLKKNVGNSKGNAAI